MNLIISPKIVLTANAVWMLTHTILFYFGSEMMVSEMSDLNEKGIITTIANAKGMGLFALVLGIFFFVATSKYFQQKGSLLELELDT